MKFKITAGVLTAVALLSLAACTKINPDSEIPVSKEDVTNSIPYITIETETKAEAESDLVTEEVTEEATEKVTEETATFPSVTEAEKETTTKTFYTTSVSEISLSIIETTTHKISTTTAKAVSTVTNSVAKNKYGVRITPLSEGVLVDRTWYTGTYDELLPAAKDNKNNYSSYIDEVLRITNQMRREKGLSPLKLSNKITEQANVRAEEIAWSGKHSHRRPDGSYFSQLFKINGYTSGFTGENIGWGYSTPAAVCEAWRNSETHYANIMDERFVSIGIGVAADPDPSGKLIWVQHFYSE